MCGTGTSAMTMSTDLRTAILSVKLELTEAMNELDRALDQATLENKCATDSALVRAESLSYCSVKSIDRARTLLTTSMREPDVYNAPPDRRNDSPALRTP
ncbi:hypothetical protein LCGC14_0455620 [marine sediment metagenome]|uniref:Uncharacterized protein n=1 Tax=marine sediment metagenome TaxID=412755 RepID=A0A0F9V3B5_9ZZZZ